MSESTKIALTPIYLVVESNPISAYVIEQATDLGPTVLIKRELSSFNLSEMLV